MPKNILLFSLQTFSTTGGIQKMTRTMAHALFHISKDENWNFRLFSLYDTRYDLMSEYLPSENYTAFNNNRIKLGLTSMTKSSNSDIVILNHINFSLIGIVIKFLNPRCQMWLITHGIEVWRPLSFIKRIFLRDYCDKIICVSNFTREQMMARHQCHPDKCKVLNNAIDPFIKLPETFDKPEYLLNRYGLRHSSQVIFTLTRLASSEQYKGHEQVIKAVSGLKQAFPNIKYILSGQYDSIEEIRIRKLIEKYDVNNEVILTGFLDDNELSDHFLLADLFVLPSKKEGFGIVFVEALACGLPVICGNADGSTDAIKDGKLGTAIDVDDLNELQNTIVEYLNKPLTFEKRKHLQTECLLYFDENHYREKLHKLLIDEQTA
ncbi:glycosyltransferase family 4 protein [Mucilaginibacter sp. BT774]|uniref:glycosyltransferase family 4 protein n=1 Tax=Mucilaginibacter sp. BT774 TaxID=3062276 RepID=UPI002677493C|nr:glycosyltransferase family 4 protein [Mucilaginibacter sp. BT774]MDO3627505.1 glycosyltransferase family 4 protein [Mucilaginibacter sp. BT774]